MGKGILFCGNPGRFYERKKGIDGLFCACGDKIGAS
jgi:hypothetical protein